VAVAVTQPTFPSLVRDWFPARIGLATGVYALGLLVGESVPASLTIPFVLPLTGNSWELSLAFWSLPVVAGAALLLAFTRQSRPHVDLPPTRWWPDWRSLRTWQIGLIMGCASAIYFGLNAFLPDFLRATGRASLTGAGLAALNTFQIPASLLMAVVADRLIGRRGPFIVTGALNLGGLLGLVLAPGYWPVVFAGVIGFSTALPLVLTLSLPPLLSAPGDVHRFSAAIFTIQYALAFLAPLLAGAVWDATGKAVVGVGLLAAIALVMGMLAVTLRLPRTQRLRAQAHL
jgi:CP family cyanate transporter-like MFS transporter